MRLPKRHDVVLWVGVAIALVVTFQQLVRDLLEMGRGFEAQYGVAVVPGLAVLVLVLVGQRLMRRAQAEATTADMSRPTSS